MVYPSNFLSFFVIPSPFSQGSNGGALNLKARSHPADPPTSIISFRSIPYRPDRTSHRNEITSSSTVLLRTSPQHLSFKTRFYSIPPSAIFAKKIQAGKSPGAAITVTIPSQKRSNIDSLTVRVRPPGTELSVARLRAQPRSDFCCGRSSAHRG